MILIPASQEVGDVGNAKKVISLTDADKWYGTVQVLKNISLSAGGARYHDRARRVGDDNDVRNPRDTPCGKDRQSGGGAHGCGTHCRGRATAANLQQPEDRALSLFLNRILTH